MRTKGVCHLPDSAYPFFNQDFCRVLTRMLKCLGRFDDTENISNALQVIAIVAMLISTRAPDNPRISNHGCPKIRYFIVAKGCSTVHRRKRITSGVMRDSIRYKASSYRVELGPVAKPVCNVISANMFRSHEKKPCTSCNGPYDLYVCGAVSCHRDRDRLIIPGLK
jgi:hypothetical protein